MADYVVVKEWYKSPEVGGVLSFDIVPDALKANVLPVGFKPYDPCETKCGDSEGLEAELEETQTKLTKAEADLKKSDTDLKKAKSDLSTANSDLTAVRAELEITKTALSECEAGKE